MNNNKFYPIKRCIFLPYKVNFVIYFTAFKSKFVWHISAFTRDSGIKRSTSVLCQIGEGFDSRPNFAS